MIHQKETMTTTRSRTTRSTRAEADTSGVEFVQDGALAGWHGSKVNPAGHGQTSV